MQISTDSWHYRHVVSHKGYAPSNICPYMRALVVAILKTLLICAVIAVVVWCVTWIALAPLVWIANHYFDFLPASWVLNTGKEVSGFMLAAQVGGIFYAIGIIIGVAASIVHGVKALRRRFNSGCTYYAPKPPGLVKTYVKGLRDKTCIGLEFVDPAADNV